MVRKHKHLGFTLIEMIVSLAVFAGVITIAVGALLVLVATSDQLQQDQNIMVNLSFALDSMTREIRTGTNYHCRSANNDNGNNNMFSDSSDLDAIYAGPPPFAGNLDCVGGSGVFHGMSFAESGNSITGAGAERIAYFFDEAGGQLFRKVGTGDGVSIISSNVYIHDVDFFVTGSVPQSDGPGEDDQASVTISLMVSSTSTTPVAEQFSIQTTVTQRTLDI